MGDETAGHHTQFGAFPESKRRNFIETGIEDLLRFQALFIVSICNTKRHVSRPTEKVILYSRAEAFRNDVCPFRLNYTSHTWLCVCALLYLEWQLTFELLYGFYFGVIFCDSSSPGSGIASKRSFNIHVFFVYKFN